MDDAIDDFDSGFNNAGPTQTTTPAEELDTAPDEVAVVVETPAPEPKYAQITEEQLANLLQISTAIPDIKAENKRQFDAAFGKIGGMKEALDKIQSATPAGQMLEISEDDFAEMREEFPELAAMQIKGMNKALSKLRGTGTAFDPSQIDGRVDERVTAAVQASERKAEAKLMRAYHRDWIDVVRSNEFKAWHETLPADERTKLKLSNDSEFVADYLDRYKASIKPAVLKVDDKAANSRQKRIEAAINPKGTGGHAAGPSEDDEFDAGFKGSS